MAEQLLYQLAIFLLKRQRKQAHVSFHKLRSHNHVIVFCIIRIALHAELVAVCAKLRLTQCAIQISHLILYLIDAGFQFCQEIILELLHGALPRRYDLLAVPGQLAILQKPLLRFVFIIVHGLDMEGARLEPVIVSSARLKQLFLRGITLIGALLQAAAEILVDNIRALQAVKFFLIPGNAGFFPVFRRKLCLNTVLHMGQLLVMIRQHLIVQLANALFLLANLNPFLLFFFI